jgi:hypothetical protein
MGKKTCDTADSLHLARFVSTKGSSIESHAFRADSLDI